MTFKREYIYIHMNQNGNRSNILAKNDKQNGDYLFYNHQSSEAFAGRRKRM